MTKNMLDLADQMFVWEAGELGHDDYLKLFGALIANEWAWWVLQGCYGREAMYLIESGQIGRDGEVNWDRVNEVQEEMG